VNCGTGAVLQPVFGDEAASRFGQNSDYLEGAATNWQQRSKNSEFAIGEINRANPQDLSK
jgi:hypothetical protein